MATQVQPADFRELLCAKLTAARDALNRARDGVPQQVKATDMLGHTKDQIGIAMKAIHNANEMIATHGKKDPPTQDDDDADEETLDGVTPHGANVNPPPPKKPVPHPHKKH